ncbi:acyltransferase family protein [Tunicatimonas pelagia]|uniref:acyltransferase family protein n=1 Tax=Tunicatimonas pelagia TaxID=931531 RepID=UPI0026660D88|nr:acyltransferase [Tunicatimonas pelagia]WKN42312.1 acyltransferase [Tunicatimonas pelagia]
MELVPTERMQSATILHKKAKVYFPGLNSLRFFAALLVFVSHVEQFKQLFGYEHAYDNQAVHQVGNLAVTFFFVLSGFLITYLLFVERENSQDISIKNFYIRRFLRIWPLYYLIVVLGMFILPQIQSLYTPSLLSALYQDFSSKLFFYIIFLPQVVLISFSRTLYIEPTWSIGIEEQFYLIWPLLVKFFPNFKKLIISLLATVVLIKLTLFAVPKITDNEVLETVTTFGKSYLHFARFQCMIIGGIGAYVLYYRLQRVLDFVYNKYFQVAIFCLLGFGLVSGIYAGPIHHELYSVLFLIIILNIATNPKSIIKIEYAFLNYLGTISYGIYMFHEIAIGLVLQILSTSFQLTFTEFSDSVLLYILSLITTIVIAACSYELFEAKFLSLKKRFSLVVSGNPANKD